MDMIRAWKDPEYRASLNSAELSALPANPAGSASLRSLSDAELTDVAAGGTQAMGSIGCCGKTWSTGIIFTCGLACTITCIP